MPKGVYSIEGRRKVWTTEDEWDVADGIARGQTHAQIAKGLGRSENSVKVHCSRNVKCREIRPLTCRRVASMLGMGCSKSVKRWIEAGYLRGRRASLGAGKAHQWHVNEDDLLAFMQAPEHWHRWEGERVTDAALREWALELRSERFLTQAEVALRYSVVVPTVAAWMDRGFLPYVDTGSHRMVRESDIASFVMPSARDRRGRPRREFTPDEDSRLVALRDGGASWSECAYQLRRDLGSCAGRYGRLMARAGETAVAA